ncbi:hypothetical protein [Microbacterium sp. RG1]|uniref:hypothetical protein n=1 Tax=Microbacterium sp. RG1 TaxID=2489212 RepID=UPI001375FF5B|nr:hypothetical protein [Microbacterium sp. RG1]
MLVGIASCATPAVAVATDAAGSAATATVVAVTGRRSPRASAIKAGIATQRLRPGSRPRGRM